MRLAQGRVVCWPRYQRASSGKRSAENEFMPATWLCSAQTTRFPKWQTIRSSETDFRLRESCGYLLSKQTPLAVQSNQAVAKRPSWLLAGASEDT